MGVGLGQVKRSGGTLSRYYYLKDHLGSIKMTVDGSANIVGYDDYYPFGMQMKNRCLESSEDARYKFTSKKLDEAETGYYYFGARYYDARVGRWMSVDPFAEKYPSISTYGYVSENPLIFDDPDGRRIRTHGSPSERQQILQMARADVLQAERSKVGLKFDPAREEYRIVVSPGFEGESKGFRYLREAVLHPANIDVTISETVTDKKSGKTWDVQKEFGGGVTRLGEEGSSEVTISPKGHIYDHDVNPLGTIFAHEVLGHSRLHQKWDQSAAAEESAIRVENEVRREQGLPVKEDARVLPAVEVVRDRTTDKRKEESK